MEKLFFLFQTAPKPWLGYFVGYSPVIILRNQQNKNPKTLINQGFRASWSNLRQIRTERRFDIFESDGFGAIMEVVSEGQFIIQDEAIFICS